MNILNTILEVLTLIVTGFWFGLALKTLNENYRPAVYFCIECRNNWIYVIIQNTGLRPAYNINITTDKELLSTVVNDSESDFTKFNKMTKSNILFLGSGTKIEYKLDNIHTRYCTRDINNIDDEIYTVEISYFSKNNKEKIYRESYQFNLKNYLGFMGDVSDLQNISNNLENIASKLEDKGNKIFYKDKQ